MYTFGREALSRRKRPDVFPPAPIYLLCREGSVPVPPAPTGAARRAKIARIRSSLPEPQRNQTRYAPSRNALWTRTSSGATRSRSLLPTASSPRGRHNSEGRCRWRGVPGCTLEAVLDHIEAGNTPRLDYLAPPSFSRHRGSSWTSRRMETAISSSSGSGSLSSGSLALRPIKPGPQETPLGRCTGGGALVINEGVHPSRSSYRLVRPKTEPYLLPVKEHETMAAADETALNWAKEDYVREQMER
ncbi:uncharacterized protein [Triticum aestivum]|uniref:uncharacterized protein n=1 Tax=Triticum aestivum TaxID=4565 RepID=UPI0008453624|nr:uncharacterized protein LOC123135980 [Triticum aestivum]XP_044411189.1 uncharacterized protein LOC123135980 [Triticum aestivum]XP_044411190.1 uncharacterized protein LOC123135980 [Triticum aestivum]